jgi:hypothetical protein
VVAGVEFEDLAAQQDAAARVDLDARDVGPGDLAPPGEPGGDGEARPRRREAHRCDHVAHAEHSQQCGGQPDHDDLARIRIPDHCGEREDRGTGELRDRQAPIDPPGRAAVRFGFRAVADCGFRFRVGRRRTEIHRPSLARRHVRRPN